jgi:VWFA-related protein
MKPSPVLRAFHIASGTAALGLASAALALGVASGAWAQEKAPPVFGADVDIVAVDVNVVDAQGKPVRRLTPADFTLTVDGKTRAIASLEYVDLSEEQEQAEAPLPSPYFGTNEGVPRGRLVMIVVDQGNIRAGSGRAAMGAADHLLDRLTPADRTALVTIPPPGPHVDFTAEHGLVRDALRKVSGRSRFEGRTLSLTEALAYIDHDRIRWRQVIDRECGRFESEQVREGCTRDLEAEAQDVGVTYREVSGASFSALGGLFEGLKSIAGPKTVLLITEGMTDDQGLGPLRDLASRAAAARVSLYILRLDQGGIFADVERARPNQNVFEDNDLRRRGMDALASMARGAVFNVLGSAEDVYDRIARELTGYYLLGFEPLSGDRDGRDHSIRVEVVRRNLTVRSRGTLNIPVAGTRPKDEQALAALMGAPFLATDLGLRAATYTLREAGGRVRVLVSAQVERARGGLTVAIALVDDKGKVAGTSAGRMAAAADPGPVPYVGSVVVPPGPYTLKLAAIDSAGRQGSLEHPVKAALISAGGLEMSDLMIGPAPTAGRTFGPSADIGAQGGLVARVEMYGQDSARLQKAEVAIEVAEGESGPALVRIPATTADAPESGRRVAQAGLALGLLPPGDYLVRAVVSMDGKAVAGLVRPFRLDPSASRTQPAAGLSIEGMAASIGRFETRSVLEPDVVGYFLGRMAALVGGAPSPEVQAASERARKGDAIGILDALPAVGPEEARFLFLRGMGLLARGQTASASTHFQTVLRLSSELFPAVFYLGACYAADGQDLQAAGAWQTALVTETGHPAIYRLLADALLRVGQGEQALSFAQEAAARWPEDDGLRRRVGLAYAMAGRRAEALAALTGYVERHPEDAGAVFVTLRMLFDAFTTDTAATPPEDRQRMLRYARSYVDAKGPNQEIVARWVRYLEKQAP